MTTYSHRVDEALQFASRLHRDQSRKSREGDEGVPYLTHLLGVASLVGAHGGSEDQVIAALLHDALEDQPEGLEETDEEVEETIRRRFGEDVLRLVEACTDSRRHDEEPWKKRKQNYLAQLHAKNEDDESLLVAVADKLHNARSILRDLRLEGPETLERFNGGVDGTLWYYRELADAFADKRADDYLVRELVRTVRTIEELVSTA